MQSVSGICTNGYVHFAPARIRTQRAQCQLYRSLVTALQLQRRKLKRHLVLLNERERAKRAFSYPPFLSLCIALLATPHTLCLSCFHVRIHFCLFVVFHCLFLTSNKQNLVVSMLDNCDIKTSPCWWARLTQKAAPSSLKTVHAFLPSVDDKYGPVFSGDSISQQLLQVVER